MDYSKPNTANINVQEDTSSKTYVVACALLNVRTKPNMTSVIDTVIPKGTSMVIAVEFTKDDLHWGKTEDGHYVRLDLCELVTNV